MLKKRLVRFGIPVLAVAVALTLKLLITSYLDESTPFLLFLAPVMIGAWFGGFGGGLLATLLSALLSALACDYFFLSPGELLLGNTLRQNIPLLIFLVEGTVVSGLSAALRAAKQRAEKQQQTLRAGEERLRLLVEGVRDYAIYTLDEAGRVLNCNPGAERVEGYTEEELKGVDQARFYPPAEIAQGVPERVLTVARSEGRYEGEGWRLRRNGSRFWAHLLVHAQKDDEGRLRGFTQIVRDVGERKRAEEALRESEERFRMMADTAPVFIWMAGPDRDYHYFNQGWLDFTGRSLAEEEGEGWVAGIHPQDAPNYIATFAAAFEAREKFQFEYRLRRHDGEFRWILNTGVPRWTTGGSFAGYIGTCVDITERKLGEEERESLLRDLVDQRGRLETVLRQMPAGVLIAEAPSGRIILSNDQLDLIWRASPGTSARLLQNFDYKGFHPSGRPYRPEEWPLLRSIRKGEVVTEEEIDFERADGSRGTMLVSSSPVRDLNGVIIAAVATFYDITERKTAERERAQLYARERMARREAEGANRTKDEFLATLSHELRTPLTSILGWVRLMRTGKLDEPNINRALETIQRSAQAQAHLIDELLDVSRVVTGKLRLETQPVELAPIVEEAVNAVRPAAEAKAINLQLMVDRQAGIVAGDPNRLHQVFWNLLSNAIKFTPRDGHVAVRVRREGESSEVAVSDTGAGISQEFLPHVFERFRQADSSATRTHGGLGLGLAIVRHLVEMHGGTVEVESRGEGQGATFKVRLPVTVASRPEAAEGKPPERPAKAKGLDKHLMLDGVRVLVVDDEVETLKLLTAVLQKYGADVTPVSSAAEAVEKIKTLQPDVLVSDVQMPGESGYDLIGKVRALGAERGGNVPAAALTAYARVEDRMRALLAGFQIHVPKPVEPAELAAVVATLAGRNGRG